MKTEVIQPQKRLIADIPYDLHFWIKTEALKNKSSVKDIIRNMLLDAKKNDNLHKYL